MGACRVKIDRDLCQGHGVCESEAPLLFRVEEGESAYPQAVVLIDPIPDDSRSLAVKAARYCPNGAITLIDVDE